MLRAILTEPLFNKLCLVAIFCLISEVLRLSVIYCFLLNFFQICCFLFNLSHKFSSYYGRVHILGVSNFRSC